MLLQEGGIHVWYACVNIAPAHLQHCWTLLNIDEKSRAERFRFATHRDRFVARRGLLRTLLGWARGQSAQSIVLSYSKFGKPYLAEPNNMTLHFNLTHSADYALIALSLGREVGIDIEQLAAGTRIDAMPDQFLHSNEIALLRALPEQDQQNAFLQLWVHKEAYVKALGKGLSHPLHDFDASQAWRGHGTESYTLQDRDTGKWWAMRNLTAPSGFAAALATEDTGQSPIPILWSLSTSVLAPHR